MDNSRETKIRQQIDAYIKGQLNEAEVQELWVEFAKNPELLDQLELEVNIREVIKREALGEKQKSKVRSLPSWTWHAAAAAIIVIVGVVQFLRVETPTQMEQFIVQEISPGEIETSEVLRSSDMALGAADSLINLGFEAVVSGEYNRALELYDEILNNSTEELIIAKAFLNKGILFYNEGEYEAATNAFQEALIRVGENGMIAEKAFWYTGCALIQLDKLEEGRDAVFKAYQLDGTFRNQAFRLLKKLNDELGNSGNEIMDSTELN